MHHGAARAVLRRQEGGLRPGRGRGAEDRVRQAAGGEVQDGRGAGLQAGAGDQLQEGAQADNQSGVQARTNRGRHCHNFIPFQHFITGLH